MKIESKIDYPVNTSNEENAPDIAIKELEIALKNREFEIQMFWQRSNYFLVLITALGVGAFSVNNSNIALFVSIAALLSSYFWFKTNLGARFWQESWEAEVVSLAQELHIRSFERGLNEIKANVKSELGVGGKKSTMRKWIDKKILTKPSVSYQMIQLSMTSVVLWAVVSIQLFFDAWPNIKMVGQTIFELIGD
jgi:hypothetical protein